MHAQVQISSCELSALSSYHGVDLPAPVALLPNPVLAVVLVLPNPPKPPALLVVAAAPNPVPAVDAGCAPNPVAGFAAPNVEGPAPNPPKPPDEVAVLFAPPPKIEPPVEVLLVAPKPVFPDPNPPPPLPKPPVFEFPKKPAMELYVL